MSREVRCSGAQGSHRVRRYPLQTGLEQSIYLGREKSPRVGAGRKRKKKKRRPAGPKQKHAVGEGEA